MRFHSISLCAALTIAALAGCSSTPSTGNAEDRSVLHDQAMSTLSQMKARDHTLQDRMDSAIAYAIFPEVTTAAVVVGGGHGRGEVYQNNQLIGYADVSQGNIGAQLGAQKYAELILFQDQRTLSDFEQNTFVFDAQASAVAAADGAAAKADYTKGVMAFSMPQGGLMLQAAIGGQSFRYIPATDVGSTSMR